jgi:hypothetical protein
MYKKHRINWYFVTTLICQVVIFGVLIMVN